MPVRNKDGAELKVIVVMPAYNAAQTLKKTYDDIPEAVVDQVILVDDVSHDSTVEIARDLGIDVVIHLQNRGYGGNQKTCYIEALRQGADIVVMLHPDYQYDSRLVPQMIDPIIAGEADLVLGSRMLGGGALKGGMPIWKYVANKFLTGVENLAFGQHLSEYHTGFRAYNRKLLERLPFLLNKDSFVFDTEVLAQAVFAGMTIAEIPVPTRYFKEASSVNFKNSVIYGVDTLLVVLHYLSNRWGLARSPQFHKTLYQVVSRHYRDSIFRQAPSAAQEESSQVSEYYLDYMSDQERFPRAGFNRTKRLFVEQTIRRALPAGARILDLGCGPGWVSHNLVHDYHVTGIDLELDAVRLCRLMYDADYLVGNAVRLPAAAGEFDAVIFTEAIEHFVQPAPALAEIARVLKPGGLALITTPNCGSLFWIIIENTWHRFFGGPCKPYNRDVHASRFTKHTLAGLLGRYFDVQNVDTVWFGLILTAIGRRRSANPPESEVAGVEREAVRARGGSK